MTTDGVQTERLRAYLRDLKPEARALLLAELERGVLSGTEVPGAALILQQLRPVLHQESEHPPRAVSPVRLFFRPLEPFLADRGVGRVSAGRVDRASIDPLWSWISGNLLPTEAKLFSEAVTGSSRGEDDPATVQATRSFQDAVAREIGTALELAAADDRFSRRLTALIRTERALEEARTLQVVLSYQDVLSQLSLRLPVNIRNLANDQVYSILGMLKPLASAMREIKRQALILVLDRLNVHWQLLRIAIRSAESDVAAKVVQSPFAIAIDMVLADIRSRIEELRSLCKRGRFAEALGPTKAIHDAIRAVRTELDLPPDSAWGRELAAIRASVSDLLGQELDMTSGWVRRLLRPRSAKEAQTAGVLDPAEVEEIEGRIEFAAVCRNYAGELAVNQVAPRVHAELQGYFDTSVATLIESLRSAEGADRRFRQSQVDAAVRFANKLFGQEFASLLSKAAAIAVAQERKPARV